MLHRSSAALLTPLGALLVLSLAACAPTAPTHSDSDSASSGAASDAVSDAAGHGAIAGAAEVAEPPLGLVAIDASGAVSTLDLLDGTLAELDAVEPPTRVDTDGRYVFAATDSGVEIVDSGVWTWDHVDHFHYYRAEARTVGTVKGDGAAAISTGLLSTAGSTGLFFPGSGDAVLLDNAALASGDIVETLRLDTGAPNGLVVPLDDGALVATAGAGSRADALRVVSASGEDRAGVEAVPCTEPAGSITTRVGAVVGCADGAVLASVDADGAPILERIAYPADAAAPATTFSARKGRPTVAGIGADAGVWLLDTRAREWTWIPTETALVAAAAVDDETGHVVTVGTDGIVRVLSAGSGEVLAATEPLLAASLAAAADADPAARVALTVDANRAYVNDPAAGVVYEIDYADGARIARVLEPGTRPDHVVEVGR
ncbi:ABC transporter [Leucobacter rhizosphaerae]|uniref:ABC transporter n=1 Tax=Leucobacter rhizosphaerae TaxID=2932245 RepID=A0ABY4FT94_9MICO|nr:ABC transporter [Leucobacter rhizosphaerae]UOQ59500.1 ABC transporter [Leucobacter rhizosphaerae]